MTRIFAVSNQGFKDTVLVKVEDASLLSGHVFDRTTAAELKVGGCLFSVDKPGYAVLRIFDLAGRLKANLYSGQVALGTMMVKMPELGAGAYLIRFESGGMIQQKRVVLR